MAAHLTPAQARALGIAVPAGARARAPKDRGTAPGPYLTECFDCREQFRTRASEDRHHAETKHARYQLVLDLDAETP